MLEVLEVLDIAPLRVVAASPKTCPPHNPAPHPFPPDEELSPVFI